MRHEEWRDRNITGGLNLQNEQIRLGNDEAWTILDFSSRESMVHGSSLIVPVFADKLVMVYTNSRAGWEFPGGKQLPGESAQTAAARELFEETGLSGECFKQICRYVVSKYGVQHHGTIFQCNIAIFEPKLKDEQALGVGLFSACPTNLSVNDGYIQLMFSRLFKY